MIKVFGIGNILLCDDGIGVKVAKYLLDNKHILNSNIEIIVGETDYMYCIDNIKKGDKVIIIDSTYFNIPPGMITKIPLEKCDEFVSGDVTSHDISLLRILRSEYREISGYLVGIEIDKIDYDINLSEKLNDKFYDICYSVAKKINKVSKEKIYARSFYDV